MEYSDLFVCLMGMGTTFVGLICTGERPAPTPAAPAGAPKVGTSPELIAAVSAAIAEEMGTDISAIRIISMKQI